MKQIAGLLLLILLSAQCTPKKTDTPFFSFHLFMEPQNLDLAKKQASSAGYIYQNTQRGIYKINDKNEPVPEEGTCEWFTPKVLLCNLSLNLWSNGDRVTAFDYVRSFQRLVDPNLASPRAHLLKYVAKYEKIMSGELPPSQLGVAAIDARTLKVEFTEKDQEFLFKLSSTALYPLHEKTPFDREQYKKFIVNGPYKIHSWIFGKEMILHPNSNYKKGHPERPKLKVYFIDDEMTAFRLYEKKELTFLRRIPTQMVPKLKARADFFRIPMLRFDYIGFGKELMARPMVRKALVHAIDFEALRILLDEKEPVGCPSIPKDWLITQPCFKFDLEKAKEYWSQVSEEDKNQIFQFKVSSLGGKDVKKQAEFIQNQWEKHLGFKTQVNQVDQKIFISELRSNPTDIFRKGVGLDRPTCYSALETFTSDSKRNYIQFEDESYAENLKKLKLLPVNSPEYKKLCQKGIAHLLDLRRLIPMGEMQFSLMASKEYTGWTLNGLNQLDLSQVHPQKAQ